MIELQSADTVLMVRPASFGFNSETAQSNRFQSSDSGGEGDAAAAARREFDALVRALDNAGVRVHVAEDVAEPAKPDAVFPNNWVSFHADGAVVLYPMLAPSRRIERRMEMIETLLERERLIATRIVDLTHREQEGKYLEGTGSLVLDRPGRVAYACVSPRTHLDVIGEFAQLLDYEPVVFDACDRNGVPVYHTNVLMALGTRFAALCVEAIPHSQRAAVCAALERGGRELIDLEYGQVEAFAGNMLELRSRSGTALVVMSSSALAALSSPQREGLRRLAGDLLAVPIPTIERLGGGSVRCMIAEVHLPGRDVAAGRAEAGVLPDGC